MRLLILSACVALLTGCAVSPEDLGGSRRPTNTVDDFTGAKTETVSTSAIGGLSSEMKAPARISFTLSRVISRTSETNFTLTVNYNGLNRAHGGHGWLFIKPGPSLTFLIDGEMQSLTSARGSEPFREVGANGAALETAHYDMPPDLPGRIAKANSVKVRFHGESYVMDKPFTEANKKTFAEFERRFL